MMIQKVLWLFISAATTSTVVWPAVLVDAFVLDTPPRTTTLLFKKQKQERTATTPPTPGSLDKSIDDQSLESLQHEYNMLQAMLLNDLVVKHDQKAVKDDEQKMIKIALQATKVNEHKQADIIDESKAEMEKLEEGRTKTQHLKEEIFHQKFEVDEDKLVDSFNTAYDDLQRFNAFELNFDLQELQAKHKAEAAQILLKSLQENEKKLQATLDNLSKEGENDATVTDEQHHHQQHRSFLNQVKDAIYSHPDLLASLDPHIF